MAHRVTIFDEDFGAGSAMPFHRCVISRDDGTVVARDIELALEEGERDGSPEWWGTLMAPTLTSLAAGQSYRIALDDRRSGAFVVRRNTQAGGADRAVAIRGTGPLR